jgi:hypothetical protein
MIEIDVLIDDWVKQINESERPRQSEFEVSSSVRIGEPDDMGYCDWCIQYCENIDWIDGLEARLPDLLPPSFLSFVSRYIFPPVEGKKIWLFANTPEGIEPLHELRSAIFEDKSMSEFLRARGYIQLGRAHEGNYDPVCFDTNRKSQTAEFPIVHIDHENILCHSKLKVLNEVAPSFLSLIKDWF